MRFIIEGNPISQLRPRFSTFGGYVRTYDPQSKQKEFVRKALNQQISKSTNSPDIKIVKEASNLPYKEPLMVEVTFGLPVPKSAPESKRNAKLWNCEKFVSKPDIDNLLKFILDCCNGILFLDDSHIFMCKCTKKYSNKPKTVIDIFSMTNILSKEVEGILQLISPQQVDDLICDVSQLCELEDNVCMDLQTDRENDRQIVLERTANILSMIASKYAKPLEKIQKKFPDYWRSNVLEEKKPQSACSIS